MNLNKKIFQLGIFSGKGGVGKTSIAASLACALNDLGISLISVDTDVDAPNLAILFQTNGKQKAEFKVKTTEKAEFLPDKCTHCKKCIDEEFCHFDALHWNDNEKIPIIDIIACEGCRACKLLCPEDAFLIKSVESGNIKHLKSKYGFDIITGETILGAQTSGKLVTELKKYTTKIAKEEHKEMIILDGPPGIGCPVIAAITDLDYVIVIIEPTVVALHDADRVISVINNFNIPFGVIINKSTMFEKGRLEILEYLKNSNIDLIGEIPLDSKWPYIIARGLPIYIESPNSVSAKILKEISQKIQQTFF